MTIFLPSASSCMVMNYIYSFFRCALFGDLQFATRSARVLLDSPPISVLWPLHLALELAYGRAARESFHFFLHSRRVFRNRFDGVHRVAVFTLARRVDYFELIKAGAKLR